MTRVYETQCMECQAYAVLNGRCRECGHNTNESEDTDATESNEGRGDEQPPEREPYYYVEFPSW